VIREAGLRVGQVVVMAPFTPAACRSDWFLRRESKEDFFFEKKKQKTFGTLEPRCRNRRA